MFDRQIVNFATDNYINIELCKRALLSAIQRYKSGTGLIHHSDRGVQYISKNYKRLFPKNHMICCMNRSGVSCVNACAQTFFSTLKLEMLYQEHYKIISQAQPAIFEYINRQRRKATIGNISHVNSGVDTTIGLLLDYDIKGQDVLLNLSNKSRKAHTIKI